VQQTGTVDRVERVDQLDRETTRGRRLEAAFLAQSTREVVAGHELHREEELPVHLARVVHAADVRVGNPPGQAGLAEQTIDPGAVARRAAVADELESHVFAQHLVASAPDLAHATRAEPLRHRVALGEPISFAEAR